MSLLTAKQAVDYLARGRTAGRRALGYRTFLRLCATGRGPASITLADGRPPVFTTEALDAWTRDLTERAA